MTVSKDNVFWHGERVKTTVTVKKRDVSDVLQLHDPSGEITVTITRPDNTTQAQVYNGGAGQVVRESLGVYSYEHTLEAQEGEWAFRWETAGDAVSAIEERFKTRDSSFI